MRLLVACRAINNMAGGVERMSSALMNEMVERGHDVFLFTWDEKNAVSFYELNKKIEWTKLDMGDPFEKASLSTKLLRFPAIRKHIKRIQPDVILGFQQAPFLSMKLATLGMGIPVIAAERNAPTRLDHMSSGKYRHIIFNSFRLADGITIQCDAHKKGYPKYLHNKMVTIPNPVFPAPCQASPSKDISPKILLSVGRLSHQKSPDVLIKAFALITDEYPDWELHIAGDGEGRNKAEDAIKETRMQKKVKLLGAVKDTSKLYCNAHLFCLASKWEGFPNGIAEASAHGLPCVAFEGCAGMATVIKDEETGLLAEGNQNAESLSVALKTLMKDGKKREVMGQKAKDAMEAYNPQKIYDIWESHLKSVAKV